MSRAYHVHANLYQINKLKNSKIEIQAYDVIESRQLNSCFLNLLFSASKNVGRHMKVKFHLKVSYQMTQFTLLKKVKPRVKTWLGDSTFCPLNIKLCGWILRRRITSTI